MNVSHPCIHCGLDSGPARFCCSGCEAAYQIVHEGGLGAFYRKAESSMRPVRPYSKNELEVFQHPDFIESATRLRPDQTREASFRIEGLYCSACIWLLEKLPKLVPECLYSEVNFLESRIYLQWKNEEASLWQIAEALSRMGYDLIPETSESSVKRKLDRELVRLGVTGGFAMAVMHLGLYFLGAWGVGMEESLARQLGMISAALSLPILFYGAEPFFRSSVLALRFGRLHADTLIIVSIGLGFIYSLVQSFKGSIHVYYDSIGMIIFLLLLGRIFIRRTTDFVSKPVGFLVDQKDGSTWKKKPVSKLKPGDIFKLEKASSLPVDAILRSKESWVDLSVVTGESMPVRHLQGAKIAQGSVLLTEEAEFEVEKSFEKSSLNELSKMLHEPRERLEVTNFEQVFVAIIFLIAIGCFFLFPFHEAIEKAIAVLIVACPCALALSKPLVADALRRQAYRAGVLILRVIRVFDLKNIVEVNFDKTGTLVEPQIRMNDEIFDGMSQEERSVLYSLCLSSSHPLSRAVAFYLSDRFSPQKLTLNVEEKLGMGVFSEFEGRLCSFRKPEGVGGEVKDALSMRSLFTLGEKDYEIHFERKPVLGLLESIEALKAKGFFLRMLTGDHPSSAKHFVESYGLKFDEVGSQLHSSDKLKYSHSKSLMVGDGLNDAEAMKASGFSIGFQGSAEHNLQSADAYLIKKDLKLVGRLIEAGKKASFRFRVNLSVSIVYNLIAISLVLGGYIGPIVCAIMMPLSSFTVLAIANARPLLKSDSV